MASAGISKDETEMLSKYFEKCVISAAGGKKLPDDKMKNATGKAIMKMVEPLMGKSDAGFCEGGVVTKLSDKKTKQMHIDTFKGDFFPELAKYAVNNIESLKKKKVTAEDYQAKLLAGVKAEMEKEKKVGANSDVVNRLTDKKGYTGAHKERFNADGTGKGLSGRVEKVDSSGYVGNYKNAGTFDKK